MELLLTLFAMLGAVTGAFSGARGLEPHVQQAEAAARLEAAAVVVEEAARPIAATIPADDPPSAEVAPLSVLVLAAAFPLYADRRLE